MEEISPYWLITPKDYGVELPLAYKPIYILGFYLVQEYYNLLPYWSKVLTNYLSADSLPAVRHCWETLLLFGPQCFLSVFLATHTEICTRNWSTKNLFFAFFQISTPRLPVIFNLKLQLGVGYCLF